MSQGQSAAAEEARKRAASEKEVMYELVHAVPTGDGVGRYAMLDKRLRFSEYIHAFVYAQRSRHVLGFHWVILKGTRAEVAATPGMISQQELADFTDDDPVTGEPALPSEHRFGVAIVDAKTGVRICDQVDGESMRYKTKAAAQGALAFAKQRLLLPNYAATGAELRVVAVDGMEDFKFEADCAAQLKEWQKGVKQ